MNTDRTPTPIAGIADPNHPTAADVRLMRVELASEWWTIALRGAMAILFGLIALAWPGVALGALALLFGVYALVDGGFAMWSAIRVGRMGKRWWPMALEGIAGIVVGLIAIVWPAMTALTLVAFIGAWAIITGVAEIVAAVRLRREIENEWLLGLAGGLSILFGLFAIASPAATAVALVWVVGVYAILFGITLVALGLKLRSWRPEMTAETSSTAEPIDLDSRRAAESRETQDTRRTA